MILTLAENVSWKAGDQIVLGTTDYTYLQSETVYLAACPECAPNQVRNIILFAPVCAWRECASACACTKLCGHCWYLFIYLFLFPR